MDELYYMFESSQLITLLINMNFCGKKHKHINTLPLPGLGADLRETLIPSSNRLGVVSFQRFLRKPIFS